MKREELKKIIEDITPEQLNAIMDLNGADIEREKKKSIALENELKESKESFDKLTSELETLKADNANGEEWKAKFEKLQSDIEAEKKQAEYDRIMKEKSESIEKRFNAVVGDKQFYNDPTRDFYLKKFSEALESKDFEGQGDSDIFHALTKDDGKAFQGVTVVKLPGGTSRATGKTYNNKEEIMAIKDRAERRQAIAENPSLFGLTNKGD